MAEDYVVEDDTGFKKSLIQFSQNTTFHGVRYIVESKSIFRRCMWILFVLSCFAAVVIQIVDRVQYFESLPLNVNVKINYNQTLKFPAVTICNQNSFRATSAARDKRYRLIEDMFSKSHVLTVEDLQRHNATDLKLDDLYTSLSHQKEDLIVSCEWNKQKCKADDFSRKLTDHGVCYSFMSKEEDMYVSSSGVDSGLRLTLNVEQYEYMTGPHDSAGIKMLLHDPREMPFVHELGQAIPTGTHAFVGVKFMTVGLPLLRDVYIENLPMPYGECDFKRLRHTDYYTTEECYADCLVGLAAAKCGCRDSYMPHVDGLPPVCSLEKYYTCLEELKETFIKEMRVDCQCPVPCQFALFDPSVSYATISNYLVGKLLTRTETSRLVDNLLHASEVTARMDIIEFNNFKRIIKLFNESLSDIKTVIDFVTKCLKIQHNATQVVFTDMMNAYTKKERLYRYQEYAIEKNFLRGREAMEERTLRTLVDSYAEFAKITARQIRRLAAMDEFKEIEREILYGLIIDYITVKQEVVELARDNMSLLLDAFLNGTAIFNYKFEDIDRSHNPFIIPKPLLNHSLNHNWYMEKYVPKLRTNDFDLLYSVLEMFINETSNAYFNRTVNDTQLNYVFERFQYACRTLMFSKSVVYSQGIELPSKILKERLLDFNNAWEEFKSKISSANQTIKSLTETMSQMNKNVLPELENKLSKLNFYLEFGNTSLTQLANTFLSNETNIIEGELKLFFQEIKSRGQYLNDIWSVIPVPTYAIWNKIINDEDMIEYYEYTNNTEFLQNLTDVIDLWNTKYTKIKEFDVRSHIANNDEAFFVALADVTNHLQAFKDSIKVDSTFLRQNFLQLDVFFRQLSYEQITQQKAYDFFALICDIGGSMGLFIGASMLTIAEILDLFLIQIPLIKHRFKSPKRK